MITDKNIYSNQANIIAFLQNAVANNGGDWLNYIQSQFNSEELKEPLLIATFNNDLNRQPNKEYTSFYIYNYSNMEKLEENRTFVALNPSIDYVNGNFCTTNDVLI